MPLKYACIFVLKKSGFLKVKWSLLYINLTMLLSIHGLFRFLSRRVLNGAHLLLTVRNTLLHLSYFSESICSGQSVLVMESFSNSSFQKLFGWKISVISKLYFSWARKWRMQFNASKCHILQVTRKKSIITHDYSLGQATLTVVPSHPYLGI